MRKICLNCQNYNHNYKDCPNSIKSWGIIAISHDNKVLMVQRKHTLGMIDFIKGNYDENNQNNIAILFKQMSQQEIDLIRVSTFDVLWKYVYPSSSILSRDYEKSQYKFEFLKKADVNLNYYLNIVISQNIPEWGFPKGRKKFTESDLDCAVREFCEETGLTKYDIDIDSNNTYTETLTGTNGKLYEHIYYTGRLKSSIILNLKNDNVEIGNIGMMTLHEALDCIKHYHEKKKEILKLIMKK
jgi:8-oxo-dGTP pyrophosphatase MutT (NUDIX family)